MEALRVIQYRKGTMMAVIVDLTPATFGMQVIARTKDAVYLRIPRELQRTIDGGCDCDQCKRRPELARWDTLIVPTVPGSSYGANHSGTVHMPDGSVGAFIEYTRKNGTGLPPVKR